MRSGNKDESKYDTSLVSYFQFLSIVFFVMGFGLFVYCFLFGFDPMGVEVLSSPVHWMVLGLGCFVVYLYNKPK